MIRLISKLFLFLVILLGLTVFTTTCIHGVAEGSGATKKHVFLQSHNTVSLRTYVDDKSIAILSDNITKNENKTLFFVIDSPGGDIDAGLRLIDLMKSSGKRFVCVAVSAASMAFSILQACDVRYMTENGMLMQHIGFYSVSGEPNRNRTYSNLVDRQFSNINQMDRTRIGLSEEQFYNKIRDDWWILSDTAVKDNVVDDVVSVSCSFGISNKQEIITYNLFFSELVVTRAGCPLITGSLSSKIIPKLGASMVDVKEELKEKEMEKRITPNDFFGQ